MVPPTRAAGATGSQKGAGATAGLMAAPMRAAGGCSIFRASYETRRDRTTQISRSRSTDHCDNSADSSCGVLCSVKGCCAASGSIQGARSVNAGCLLCDARLIHLYLTQCRLQKAAVLGPFARHIADDTLCYKQGGAKHGLGTYTWPNMAAYKGEWQNGCMHGVGTFKSPDGTMYEVSHQPKQIRTAYEPLPLLTRKRAIAEMKCTCWASFASV